ncbi:MAG: DMT family transporter [Methyloligellaceae bacterium]
MINPLPSHLSRIITAFLSRQSAKWRALPGNIRGGLWLIFASGFFTVMAALIKTLGDSLHVTEMLFFRQLFMVLLALPVIVRDFPAVLQTTRLDLQLIRLTCALGAMLMGFTAVIHLPLADATTIAFSRTFFITIFAIIVLHETVGIRRWAAILAGFTGVLIVAQPGGAGSVNVYGLLAIVGAACAGAVMILVRILSQTDRPVTILAYQAIGIGLLMVPPTIWFWKMPTFEETLLLIVLGVVSLIGQTCNIFGFRAGEASAIAPFDYMRLLFAVLIGYFVFNDWPAAHVFAGAAIIIAAAVYTMHREQRLAKKRAGKD